MDHALTVTLRVSGFDTFTITTADGVEVEVITTSGTAEEVVRRLAGTR